MAPRTINKDTKLYFSISSNSGNFGATLYNAAFEHLGINAIYKPLQIKNYWQIRTLFDFLRETPDELKGISVSMPFKKYAAISCDEANHMYVNTVVSSPQTPREKWNNQPAKILGYNTDSLGFIDSCNHFLSSPNLKGVIVFGKGALAETISLVLKERDIKFYLTKEPDALLDTPEYNFLINTTPVGMDHLPDYIFKKKNVKNFDMIFDCVVKKETNLIKLAKELNKEHVNGVAMSLAQLCHQFFIYTGELAPKDLFEKEMKKVGYV